jgi:hypothetical protein
MPLRTQLAPPGQLHGCILCGTEDMYVQKDFPQSLGLTILGIGIILSTILWWQYWYLAALGCLVVSALVDCALYYVVPDVTVCYRCAAQYRGVPRRHEPFDLAIGERYRQEKMRIDELRRAAERRKPSPEPPPTG